MKGRLRESIPGIDSRSLILRRMARLIASFCCTFALLVTVSAQPVFRGSDIFPAEEFAARRSKIIDKIGDAVAIVLGTTQPPGEMPFRQNNQFFYLSGAAEPRSYLLIDGRTKRTTLFLPAKNDRTEQSMYGPAMSPGADAIKATGVDETLPNAEFTKTVNVLIADGRAIY